MRVPQQFIYLSNVPLDQLEDLAKQLKIDVAKEAPKWEYVRLLSQQRDGDIAPRMNAWAHAGKTSVTFVRLGQGDPLDPEAVETALTDICDGVDPLQEDVRPESLTHRSTLIAAEKIGDKFFLMFGVKSRESQYLRDFELETVERDEYFAGVIRPAKAILELRTNSQRAHRLITTWVADFSDLLFPDAEKVAEG